MVCVHASDVVTLISLPLSELLGFISINNISNADIIITKNVLQALLKYF